MIQAIEDTKRHFKEAEESAYRASFIPHAIIATARKIPQPIFVAAVIGVDRLLRIDFENTEDPTTFIKPALDGVKHKCARWGCNHIPAFEQPTSVILNYSPDHAVGFDLQCSRLLIGHDCRATSLLLDELAALANT